MKSTILAIEFCMQWNYAPKAAGLAEQLFEQFRHQISKIELIASSGGAFEVFVNSQKVYSKLETGEHPSPQQIIQQVQELIPLQE